MIKFKGSAKLQQALREGHTITYGGTDFYYRYRGNVLYIGGTTRHWRESVATIDNLSHRSFTILTEGGNE